MAGQEKQHPNDADRVLIRPSTCSTYVEKKSSVGHVPHEPSKGAVGHDVCHSAVSANASTAAHGGLRVTAKTSEIKRKHSATSRRGEVDGAQYTVSQSSLVTQGHVPHVAANSDCHDVVKSPVEEHDTSVANLLYKETAQMLKSDHIRDLSSTVSLSESVDSASKTGLFPRLSLNDADSVNTTSASASGNVEMLETEVMSLREQLVIQSKVSM